MGADNPLKVLVIVKDLKGRERGANWGDVTFFETQSDRIGLIRLQSWPTQNGRLRPWHLQGQGFAMGPSDSFPKVSS